MIDLKNSPYAPFLEHLVRDVLALSPVSIGFVALLPDGGASTRYFGVQGPADIAAFAFQMESDAMYAVVEANARAILRTAEEAPEEDEGDDESEEELP